MRTSTRRRRQPVVERVADEHVREAEVTRGAGHAGEDPRRDRLVERIEQNVGIFGERREDLEWDIAPEDRGRVQRCAALGRERRDAPSDGFLHAVGDLVRKPDRCALRARIAEHDADDLADEQWVSLGALLECVDDGRLGFAAGHPRDVLRDLSGRKALQRQAPGIRHPTQLGERRRERMVRRDLG